MKLINNEMNPSFIRKRDLPPGRGELSKQWEEYTRRSAQFPIDRFWEKRFEEFKETWDFIFKRNKK